MTFLTGSTAYAIRMVYDWLCGVRPTLDGLAIDPCLPSHFRDVAVSIRYLGRTVRIAIRNPHGRQAGVQRMTVNGAAVTRTEIDPFSGRALFVADDALFTGDDMTIEVVL